MDLDLRGETKALFTPIGLSLLLSLGFYLTITPGVLGGFVDYYILRPLLGQKRYTIDDFVIGSKLGEGGFGVVYKATGAEDGNAYVLKRCKDYGEAEIWTNSRLMRACPDAIASYCCPFHSSKYVYSSPQTGRIRTTPKTAVIVNADDDEPDTLWLLWQYEGSL